MKPEGISKRCKKHKKIFVCCKSFSYICPTSVFELEPEGLLFIYQRKIMLIYLLVEVTC